MSSTAPNVEARFGRLALTGAAVAILAALLALAALAWAYVASQGGAMTMSAGPDGASFAIFLATWVVMMAAMMFPAFAPVVLVYAQYTRQRTGTWPLLAAVFVAGYLTIWSAVGVGAYVLVALLVPIIAGIPIVHAAPQVFLGAVIGAAGLYQLTPLKDAMLAHCRSPFHWLFRGFRPGVRGALLMGIDEGVVLSGLLCRAHGRAACGRACQRRLDGRGRGRHLQREGPRADRSRREGGRRTPCWIRDRGRDRPGGRRVRDGRVADVAVIEGEQDPAHAVDAAARPAGLPLARVESWCGVHLQYGAPPWQRIGGLAEDEVQAGEAQAHVADRPDRERS